MTKPENVILLTIDCLRPDHLSCYGYKKKTSPNIDALAQRGVLFTQAFANGQGTHPCFPPILTSTYPLSFGLYDDLSHRMLISEVLKGEGYATAGFCSNPLLSSYYGYNRGFDFFTNVLSLPKSYTNYQKMERKIKRVLIKKLCRNA